VFWAFPDPVISLTLLMMLVGRSSMFWDRLFRII